MAVTDIIVTPCRILYSAVGGTLPADTVAYDGAWGAAWTELGYTKTPLTVNYEEEHVEHDIQEALAPVHAHISKKTLALETTLAEFTGANLALALNGTQTDTAAGAGQPEKEEVDMGNSNALTIRQWGFEGQYVDEDGTTHPIRIFLWKGKVLANAELQFAKDDSTGIPLHIDGLMDLTQSSGEEFWQILKITEEASS